MTPSQLGTSGDWCIVGLTTTSANKSFDNHKILWDHPSILRPLRGRFVV